MSLFLGAGYNGGPPPPPSGQGSISGGSPGAPVPGAPGGAPSTAELLYQDVGVPILPITTHDPGPLDLDWHHHTATQPLTQDHHHIQDIHSPYSMDSDSAIGPSPSPELSFSGLSGSSNNCVSSGCYSSGSSSSSSGKDDAGLPVASAMAVYSDGCVGDKKAGRRRGQQQQRRARAGRRTPPRHNIDVNDNSLYAVCEFFKGFMSASSASTVAIDNKIEQAMDLVKSHLMFAVREEVEVLKEKITELMERINQLEYENTVLKQYATNEALQQIQQHHNSNT